MIMKILLSLPVTPVFLTEWERGVCLGMRVLRSDQDSDKFPLCQCSCGATFVGLSISVSPFSPSLSGTHQFRHRTYIYFFSPSVTPSHPLPTKYITSYETFVNIAESTDICSAGRVLHHKM